MTAQSIIKLNSRINVDEYVETKPDSCPYVMDVVGSPPPTEAPCRVKCPLPLFPQEHWESDMYVMSLTKIVVKLK